VSNGLILLAFIAIVLALVMTRFRRRLGMRATGSVLAATACAFAIAILVLWATSRR
jgi:hypothetical protein